MTTNLGKYSEEKNNYMLLNGKWADDDNSIYFNKTSPAIELYNKLKTKYPKAEIYYTDSKPGLNASVIIADNNIMNEYLQSKIQKG